MSSRSGRGLPAGRVGWAFLALAAATATVVDPSVAAADPVEALRIGNGALVCRVQAVADAQLLAAPPRVTVLWSADATVALRDHACDALLMAGRAAAGSEVHPGDVPALVDLAVARLRADAPDGRTGRASTLDPERARIDRRARIAALACRMKVIELDEQAADLDHARDPAVPAVRHAAAGVRAAACAAEAAGLAARQGRASAALLARCAESIAWRLTADGTGGGLGFGACREAALAGLSWGLSERLLALAPPPEPVRPPAAASPPSPSAWQRLVAALRPWRP